MAYLSLMKPLPAALLLVLLWTACRLVFLFHTGIHNPQAHDEFSYILGADTFAHGRLVNPAPPLGKFFESPHELVRPVYASKYPPGQAMFLALGQVLFGAPFYGVIIGNALMLFTFCLMLFAWVTPQWAMAVTAMFGLVLSPAMYWTTSYWGGSVAASGGALALLAIGLYRRKQTPLAGVVFALGALLLFWTRPYEGGVFTLALLIVFAGDLWQRRRAGVCLAALSLLAVGVVWTCYDNYAVTGNPLLLPYMLHARQYDATPVFWFLPMRDGLTYSTPRLAAFHGPNGEEASFYKRKEPRWKLFIDDLIVSTQTPDLALRIGVLMTLLVPVALRDPVFKKMAVVATVILFALSIETFHEEHYSAPVWAGLALMIAIWAERAWNLRIAKLPVGAVLTLLILALPVIVTGSQIAIASKNHQLDQHFSKSPSSQVNWSNRRTALIRRLTALQEPQLVFVRYPSPDWRVTQEWVYNSADIDHQRVILAHDFGPEQDRALLNYYPNRAVWLLTFDPSSGREHIEPYSLAAD